MDRKQANQTILVRLSRFLQGTADLGRADVEMLSREYDLPLETAALMMLSASLGLDTEQPEDRMLEEQYLAPGFRLLSPDSYLSDAYRQQIRFPDRADGGWAFVTKSVKPYEVFVRDDLVITDDGREIPQIGAFPNGFSYPAVLQDGREWMTLAPVEIETMREPIRSAHGHVLTFGLGMGYYAYHVSSKTDVADLTIVERDPALIRLFSDYLLPQFPGRSKIEIAEIDAFDYLDRQFDPGRFDSIFCDIWHDVGDGVNLYLRFKHYEKRYGISMKYWIEGLLKQAVRIMGMSV